jgi:hypothetical protein
MRRLKTAVEPNVKESMNLNQISTYIFICTVLVVFTGAGMYLFHKKYYSEQWSEFSGYIIDDEELSGFFSCSSSRGMSFTDIGNTGISKEYSYRKTQIREPIYVEFVGRIAGIGGSGWGIAGEPWEKNVEIKSIKKIECIFPENCEAKPPYGITVEFDENP